MYGTMKKGVGNMKRFLLLFLSLSLVLSLIGGMVSFGAEDIVFYESFENGLSDWSFGKEDFKENFAVVKDASTDGKASLKIIDNRDDASISVVSKAFKAEAGCNYTIKADFNILEGTGASGKIYLRFKDATGKILASKSKQAQVTNGKMLQIQFLLLTEPKTERLL